MSSSAVAQPATQGPDAPTTAVDPADRPLLTHRQILAIFAGLMAGMFLAALDQTIVATSVRTIADDLNGLSLQASVTTAYLITSTITTPLYGKLSDLYGRKPLFLFAISVFMVGSLASMFSQSMYELAAFRAIQGLGAGGLFSLSLTIIGDIVAPRERARYQGYFVAVFGTSSVLGPLVGGWLAGQSEIFGITGWRWVFGINLPIGLIALIIVTKVLNIPHTKRAHRIDWPGAVALVIGLVPLLLVAEQGRAWGWTSFSSVLCFVVGAVGLVLFVLAERRYGDDALLPLRFFRHRVFGLGTLASLLVGMGMFGAMAAMPLYLQIVRGMTPTQSGLHTLPLVVGIMSMSITSGRIISKVGKIKMFPVVGVALMIVGLLLFARVGVDTPFWRVALCMLVFGWGLGANMQPLTLAIQNAMPPKDMGVATASATFFRQMGGTLGTAVFLSILFSTVGDKITSAFRSAASTPGLRAAVADPAVVADPANAGVLSALSGATPGGIGAISLDNSSFIGALDPRLAHPFLEGFSGSMTLMFLTGAAVLVAAFALVCLMPEVPLRQMSGIEAQRAAPAGPDAAPPTGPNAVPLIAEPIVESSVSSSVVGSSVPSDVSEPVEVSDSSEPEKSPAPKHSAPPGNEQACSPFDVPGQGECAGSLPPVGSRNGSTNGNGRVNGSSSGQGLVSSGIGDRVLRRMIPDVDGMLETVLVAEHARDEVRRARRELNTQTAALFTARAALVRHGLSEDQIDRLLELSPAESDRART